jgi:hypothetical protein
MCTGAVETTGSPDLGGIHIDLIDEAGNLFVSDGDLNRTGRQLVEPTCLVPDRFVDIPYPVNSTPLHVRTDSGIPLLLSSAEGRGLDLSRHDGLSWRTSRAFSLAGFDARGRIASTRDDAGNTWFCTTFRETSAIPYENHPAFDNFNRGGLLALGRIDGDGAVTVGTLPFERVTAAGCGIDFDRGTGRLVVTANAASQTGAEPGLPWVRRCDASVPRVSCDPLISIANLPAVRTLGYDPDVAVIGNIAHVVGRGTLRRGTPTAPGRRLEEYGIYAVEVALDRRSPPRIRDVLREGDHCGVCIIRQGLRPRVTEVSMLPVITYQRSTNVTGALELVADLGGTTRTLVRLGNVVRPFAPLFPDRRLERPVDFLAIGGVTTPVPREAELAPGFDVLSEAGVVLGLAFERRNTGGYSDTWSDYGGAEPEDRSSLWYARFRLGANRTVTPVGAGPTRVDVETGHEPQSARHVSLFVRQDLAPLDALPEPSVVYDNVRFFTDPLTTRVLYADARVGQFVEHRTTEASQRRSPRAPVFQAGPAAGTCWSESSWLTDLSEPEANLTPEAVVDDWASPRLESTVTGFSSRQAYRQATGAAECLLRELSEATTNQDWDGLTERAFADQVRERFAGNYLSLASSLSVPGPAILQTRRFPLDTQIPAGTLIVDVNGRRFTGINVSATDFQTAARRISLALSRSGSNSPVLTYHEYAEGYRLAIHTQRPATGGEELQVLDTPLAQALGFPIAQVSRSSWIDPRNGDYEDRLAACEEREPCVANSAPDTDDGTCGRPSECMGPGQALVDALFRDLDLTLGAPPQRTGQEGVCVPTTPILPNDGDVCATPHAAQPGTNQSYDSFVQGSAPCGPFGLAVGFGRCLSCDDGLRAEASDPADRIGPSGTPRLCTSDLDCSVTFDCSGPDACTFGAGSFLCTHLAVPFAGVPAGQGFCARPDTGVGSSGVCVAGRIDARPLPRWHPEPTCEEGDGPRTISVCRARYAVNPSRDFEPARLECVAAGCSACLGRYGPQSYCAEDAECPSGHRCVLDQTAGIRSPACLLRPILGDGRFNDSLNATRDRDRIRSVSPDAADALDVAPRTIDEGLRAATQGLRALIPARYLATLQDAICEGDDAPRRPLRALITGLRAHTTGARITMVPDEAPLAGAGDILVDLFLDGRIDASGRVEGDVDLGEVHGFDTDVRLHVDAEGVRLRLRPFLANTDSGPKLDFRLTVELMRELSATDPSIAVPAEASNVHIDYSSQQSELLDWIRALTSVLFQFLGFVPDLILTTAFENWNTRLGDAVDEGLTAAGDVVAGVIFSDPVGPALFGEELLPLGRPTLVEGVVVQSAQDHSLSRPGLGRFVGPSLGVYGRRFPAQGLPTERAVAAAALGSTAGVCGLVGQRDPNCLQRATDPSTCPPCGAQGQECCGTCCGTGCPGTSDPGLTCTLDEPTGVRFCRAVPL